MSLTIEYANSPVWADQAGTAINLMVKFVEMATVLPFTATPTDDTTYGPELYANAAAGVYGTVAPYVAPPVVITTGPATLAAGLEGVAYVATLTASGGTAPYTYAVAAGSTLPSGLRIQDNVIVGTPSYSDAGNYSFVITATDANQNTGNSTIAMAIYDATPPA